MTKAKILILTEKLKYTLDLLIDEISMVSNLLLGALEKRVAETLHECSNSDQSWGYIPIVIVFGDDYQLPCMTG